MARPLAHLGYAMSDQPVGNILKRHGIPPVPEKNTTPWPVPRAVGGLLKYYDRDAA
jgi:hypothetical protein